MADRDRIAASLDKMFQEQDRLMQTVAEIVESIHDGGHGAAAAEQLQESIHQWQADIGEAVSAVKTAREDQAVIESLNQSLQDNNNAFATVQGALFDARQDVIAQDDVVATLNKSLEKESEALASERSALAAAKQVIAQKDNEIFRLNRELEKVRERSSSVSSSSVTMRALLERVQDLEKRVQDAEVFRQSTRLAMSSRADVGNEAAEEAATVGDHYQIAAEKKYRWNLVATEALDASRKVMELEATMATKRQFTGLSQSSRRHEYQLAELRQHVLGEPMPPWLTNADDEDDVIEDENLGIMYKEPLPYVSHNEWPDFKKPQTLKRAAADALLSPRGKARRLSSSPLPNVFSEQRLGSARQSGLQGSQLQHSGKQVAGSSRQTHREAVDEDLVDPLGEHVRRTKFDLFGLGARPERDASPPAAGASSMANIAAAARDDKDQSDEVHQSLMASQGSQEPTERDEISLIDQAADLFQFTWGVTEDEENDFLEGLRRKLSRKKSLAAFEESADKYCIGSMSMVPDLPRPCFFGVITGFSGVKGGPRSAHSACGYCKDRKLGTCFIVTHAPGVDTGFGDRDNDGVIPKDVRQPRLVDIGGRGVRYIVRKRKARAADQAQYPPVTVYGVVV